MQSPQTIEEREGRVQGVLFYARGRANTGQMKRTDLGKGLERGLKAFMGAHSSWKHAAQRNSRGLTAHVKAGALCGMGWLVGVERRLFAIFSFCRLDVSEVDDAVGV